MGKRKLLTYRQTQPGHLKCTLNLSELYHSERELEAFRKRYKEFRKADLCNGEVYQLTGTQLTYDSEQLIPIKEDKRVPLLLVFGNPASHSVKEGMFFSFEGDGKEHRFWKHIMRPSGILDLVLDESLPVKERNKRRKRRLLAVDYDSPFRIGLCVFVSLPSGASRSWAGIAGVQRLLGSKWMKELESYERERVLEAGKKFLAGGGNVVVFQKNAWEGLRSDGDPPYSLNSAKNFTLKGRVRGMPHAPLFGVPPTRLSGPCRVALENFFPGEGANIPRWKWIEGIVDTEDDHIKIRYEKNPDPAALIAPGKGNTFIVQFLETYGRHERREEMMGDIRREIDYYLVELHEKNPWAYAIYHCSTAANVYSKVHWGYYPKGFNSGGGRKR